MTQVENPNAQSHNSQSFGKSRGWIRFALVAAILPHVTAIVILAAFWLTRASHWDVIALISAFACFLLWAVGLGCLAKAYHDRSASDRLIYATGIMLGLSVPASLA